MKIKVTNLLLVIAAFAAPLLAQEAKTPVEAAKKFWEALSETGVENAKKTIDEKFTGDIDKRLLFESDAIRNRKLILNGVLAKSASPETAQVEFKLKDKDDNDIECLIILFKSRQDARWKIIYWSFNLPLTKLNIRLPKNLPNRTLKPDTLPTTDPPVINPNSFKNGD